MTIHNETARAICAVICRSQGIKAREIASRLGLDKKTVNQALYHSPLMQELCYQDREHRWHGLVRQERPHGGLMEFSGYYGPAREFVHLSEEAFLEKLT